MRKVEEHGMVRIVEDGVDIEINGITKEKIEVAKEIIQLIDERFAIMTLENERLRRIEEEREGLDE